jgi:hypothetical protein
MEQQGSAVAKSRYHQIRNIGHIRSYITEHACKTLICSLVTSRLDYGNALLYNVNSAVIARLQRVQNMTARMITRKKKFYSITLSLMQLHWLPVKYRSHFKLLLYVVLSHYTAKHPRTWKNLSYHTHQVDHMKISYNNREMFALKHTAKGDSTELGLHCGMIFQFICGKNSLFLFLRKV